MSIFGFSVYFVFLIGGCFKIPSLIYEFHKMGVMYNIVSILYCHAKPKCLSAYLDSRYCLLALHGSIDKFFLMLTIYDSQIANSGHPICTSSIAVTTNLENAPYYKPPQSLCLNLGFIHTHGLMLANRLRRMGCSKLSISI